MSQFSRARDDSTDSMTKVQQIQVFRKLRRERSRLEYSPLRLSASLGRSTFFGARMRDDGSQQLGLAGVAASSFQRLTKQKATCAQRHLSLAHALSLPFTALCRAAVNSGLFSTMVDSRHIVDICTLFSGKNRFSPMASATMPPSLYLVMRSLIQVRHSEADSPVQIPGLYVASTPYMCFTCLFNTVSTLSIIARGFTMEIVISD